MLQTNKKLRDSAQQGNMQKIEFWPYSSSSGRAANTDIPDLLSPLLPIVHRFW